MNIHSNIQQFVSFPRLTHLAVPLHESIERWTKTFSAMPKMKRLVIFYHVGFGGQAPLSRLRARRTQKYESTDDVVAIYTSASEPPLPLPLPLSDELGDVFDGRLVVYSGFEMGYFYKLSNEEFWDEVERSVIDCSLP